MGGRIDVTIPTGSSADAGELKFGLALRAAAQDLGVHIAGVHA